jgi:hypothetical protein
MIWRDIDGAGVGLPKQLMFEFVGNQGSVLK